MKKLVLALALALVGFSLFGCGHKTNIIPPKSVLAVQK